MSVCVQIGSVHNDNNIGKYIVVPPLGFHLALWTTSRCGTLAVTSNGKGAHNTPEALSPSRLRIGCVSRGQAQSDGKVGGCAPAPRRGARRGDETAVRRNTELATHLRPQASAPGQGTGRLGGGSRRRGGGAQLVTATGLGSRWWKKAGVSSERAPLQTPSRPLAPGNPGCSRRW
eukprot:174157-Prorocentrum_minimum.AAC.5